MKSYQRGNALIPEYRTDRNGRNVLRHVRRAKEQSEKTLLSAATPTVSSNHSQPVFNEGFQKFWDQHEISDTGYSAKDFAPQAIEAINYLFSPDCEVEGYRLTEALGRGFSEMMGFDEEEDGLVSVHNVAAFAGYSLESSDFRSLIEGLHRTLGYRKDYLLEADGEERDVAGAIMAFTSAISERSTNWDRVLMMDQEKYTYYISLKNDELLDLVIEYAPRIDELLEHIHEDEPVPHAEVLRERLNHTQKSLAKGIL